MKCLTISGIIIGVALILYGGIFGLYLKYVRKDLVNSKKLFRKAIKGIVIILLFCVVWFLAALLTSISGFDICC